MLAAINAQAFRAHEMIADMMLFARPPELKREAFDLAELASTICEELRPLAANQQTELIFETAVRPLTIMADKTQIAVALRALCANALEALVRGGCVSVALEESSPFGDFVQIAVSDNGPGIAAEARRPHLRSVLFGARSRSRVGLRAVEVLADRDDARWSDRSRKSAERGHAFHDRPAPRATPSPGC